NRALEPSPAHGAIRGAPESRVQLTHGLFAPSKNRPLCRGRRARLPPGWPPFHPLRVGNASGELTRDRGRRPGNHLGAVRTLVEAGAAALAWPAAATRGAVRYMPRSGHFMRSLLARIAEAQAAELRAAAID